MVGRDIKN